MGLSKAETDAAHDAHRREQVRHIARTTSVEDRIGWLEEMLAMNPEARLREAKRRADRALALWEGRVAQK
jgi:hypothetical protein